MTPERWQQIKNVFDQALQQDVARRTAFLGEVCAGDDQLRSEVESLLSAYVQAGETFIETPALPANMAVVHEFVQTEDRMVGRRIGSYKVIKEIGRGGMGYLGDA